MSSNYSNSSLAVAAGGVFAYVILVSGVWHPKAPAGGLTQVGRHASVAFEDGSVAELTEPETDLDILRRRRMAGWQGRDYRQTFIMADGEEMEVVNNGRNGDLSTGSHLILAANSGLSKDQDVPPPLDSGEKVTMAALKVDGKDQTISKEIDGKDRVAEDIVDAKDRLYPDPKDAKDTPVFALYNKRPTETPSFDLMGPDGIWGNLRTTTPLFSSPGGGSPGGGGPVTGPPSGTSVPEPSTWSLLGIAGVTVGAFSFWGRRKLA